MSDRVLVATHRCIRVDQVAPMLAAAEVLGLGLEVEREPDISEADHERIAAARSAGQEITEVGADFFEFDWLVKVYAVSPPAELT